MSENQRVSVDRMADVIMEGLTEYAELAADVMKDCVRKAGDTVKWCIAGTGISLPIFWRRAMRSGAAGG